MSEHSLDFGESAELRDLRRHFRRVDADAVERYGSYPDSWIVGFSKEFSAG